MGTMLELYQSQVNEIDKKGYAEIFVKCTEAFFKEWKKEKLNVIDESVNYLDGYFIFGKGTNSVVHFKVKECPGWLFGIWWEIPEKGNTIKGTFFTQYEKDIDKFKPSYSAYTSDLYFHEDKDISCFDEVKIMNFINKEPYLAWYRDQYLTDFNTTWVDKRKAKRAFERHIEKEANLEKEIKTFDENVLQYVKNNIVPYWNDFGYDCYIWDQGENVSPRYELIGIPKESKLPLDIGTYVWLDDEEKESKKIAKEYSRFIKKLQNKLDNKYNNYHSTLHPTIYIINEEILNKLKGKLISL